MKYLVYIPPFKFDTLLFKDTNLVFQLFGNKYWIEVFNLNDTIEAVLDGQTVLITQDSNNIDKTKFVLNVISIQDFLNGSSCDEKWINSIEIIKSWSYLKESVHKSWTDSFFLKMESNGAIGLREPQYCALHAIHANLPNPKITTQTVVLPTGTGKTETMLSLVASGMFKTILVIVPSNALREQIGDKFLKFGVLREIGVLSNTSQNPIVCKLKNNITDANIFTQMLDCCNVIVATINSLHDISNKVSEIIKSKVDLLIFDEAHHEAADKWRKMSSLFSEKKILQFTATPYRNDNKALSGIITYNFPLKRSQELGYFSKITFESICVYDAEEADKKIAQKSIKRLKEDIAQGYNHILMARASTIERANKIFTYYEAEKDLNPIKINSDEGDIVQIKKGILNGKHKIIICVNMLGEGFDLPELKIAALHDNHKSLPVFLQFIGRFARERKDLGEAYVVANIDSDKTNESMQEIWNSKDWNQVLTFVSAKNIEAQVEFQKYIENFSDINAEFPIQSLIPTLSTLIYNTNKCSSINWNTREVLPLLKGKVVFEDNIDRELFIIITEQRNKLGWVDNSSLYEKSYNLYIFYYSHTHKLLFVSGNSDKTMLKTSIKALIGNEAELITGESIFRCFYNISRVKLVNMGLYTPLLFGTSYEQRMGRRVNESISQFEKSQRDKGNFFGIGYENGEPVSIGCTKKGRIWSYSHDNILGYKKWCDNIGSKILNESILEEDYLKGFIVPVKLDKWPDNLFPISLDWCGDSYSVNHESLPFTFGRYIGLLMDLSIELNTLDNEGRLFFIITNGHVKITIMQLIADSNIIYEKVNGEDLFIGDLNILTFLQENPLRIWLNNMDYIEGLLHFCPFKREDNIFNFENIIPLDFLGNNINIKNESQGFGNKIKTDSIQNFIIKCYEKDYDIVFNDDNSGELADIVAIKVYDNEIIIDLFHCKYASKGAISAKISNFYEVCGQAIKMIRKIEDPSNLFDHLKKREVRKRKTNPNHTRFYKGNEELLNNIKGRCKYVRVKYTAYVVQPSVTKSMILEDILILLANVDTFLNTMGINFRFICSED